MSPVDIFGTFGAQALAVVPWIAAGVAAAIGLYFAVLGIRKGLAWFFSIVEGRGRVSEDNPDRVWALGEIDYWESAGALNGFSERERAVFERAYIDDRLSGADARTARDNAFMHVDLIDWDK